MAVSRKDKRVSAPVVWSLSVQALVLVVIGTPLYLWDGQIALSAAVGGLIFIISNAYFAFYAFRFQGESQAILIAKSSLQGLMGKFALSAAGFAVAFTVLQDLHGPTVLLVYTFMVLVQVLLAKKLSDQLEAT